jgi:hypothetical protein
LSRLPGRSCQDRDAEALLSRSFESARSASTVRSLNVPDCFNRQSTSGLAMVDMGV